MSGIVNVEVFQEAFNPETYRALTVVAGIVIILLLGLALNSGDGGPTDVG